jgi:alpha-galactosidase
MCHGYAGVYSVANRLGLNPDDISFEIPGVNHFIWLTKLLCNGEDVLHRLREWVSERSAEHFKTCGMSAHEGPKPVDLYRRYGAFPIGDTANPGGGAWGWWYHVDDATERRWQEDPYQWYLRHFEGGLAAVASMSRTAHDPAASVRALFPEVVSRDPMIPLIEALSGRAERVVIVNTLNGGGYVPGVPADYEVEVPALCTRNGVHPMRTDGLPQALLAHLLSDRVAPVETELAAYEQGSRKLLLDLMLQDPFTRSLDQAEKFLDAILALPYHSEMREHYR